MHQQVDGPEHPAFELEREPDGREPVGPHKPEEHRHPLRTGHAVPPRGVDHDREPDQDDDLGW